MTTLLEHIAEETRAAAALDLATKQHKASLQALCKPLQELCERYETLFEPIQHKAYEVKLAVPEMNPKHPPSENQWGNNGLNRLTHLPSGFTEIYTDDYFRNERDVFLAVIPSKYLGDDGIALMAKDAARIQSEIAVLKTAKSIEVEASLEVDEREELARLQAKYHAQ